MRASYSTTTSTSTGTTTTSETNNGRDNNVLGGGLLYRGGGGGGGIQSPMSSMVSGFLADQVEQEMESSRSFSHLLAGAIAAPTTTTATTSSSGALVVGENNQGLGEELATESSRPGSSPGGNGAGGGGGAGGSFADRMAARGAANTSSSSSSAGVAAAAAGSAEAGGGAPRPPSSSVRFGSLPPSRIPIPRSTGYLTIPPGLSPTTLFDSSPVLLSTSQSEPSPTTGTFPLGVPTFFNPSVSTKPAIIATEPSSKDKVSAAAADQGFVFKPFVKPVPQNAMSRVASSLVSKLYCSLSYVVCCLFCWINFAGFASCIERISLHLPSSSSVALPAPSPSTEGRLTSTLTCEFEFSDTFMLIRMLQGFSF
jgi:hypothetical protein